MSLLYQFLEDVYKRQVIGILIGFVGKFIFKRLKDLDAGYYHLLILGLIFLSFGFAELCRANGLMAVFLSLIHI